MNKTRDSLLDRPTMVEVEVEVVVEVVGEGEVGALEQVEVEEVRHSSVKYVFNDQTPAHSGLLFFLE